MSSSSQITVKVAAALDTPEKTLGQAEACTHTSHEDVCLICMFNGLCATLREITAIWSFHFFKVTSATIHS